MEIRKLLLECGINPAQKGFRYLHDAIQMRIADPDLKLVWGVFVRVGMRYHAKCTAVERCCRHALKKAAERHGTDKASALLGQPPMGGQYTSRDFVALAALACQPKPRHAAAACF